MTYGPPNPSLYDDRLLSGLAYAGSPPCYSDSEPDSSPRRQLSRSYLPPSSAVVRLQDPHIKCDRNLGWNIDWAVAFIVDHLDNKNIDAAESLRNIRIKAATLERDGFAEDIPYRIFDRLNDTLFAGYLKNTVYLSSSSLGPSVSGATYTQNWGPVTSVPRISIILNSDVLNYARSRDIVALLIHQMIHAYFLVACGPQKEDQVSYGRLSHGYHFGKIMSCIKTLSAAHGRELTSLDYGHDLDALAYYDDKIPRHRNTLSSWSSAEREKWYCSHCYSNTPSILLSSLEKWYNKTISPLLTHPISSSLRSATVQIYNERRHELEIEQRGHLPPSTRTIEVVYRDTCTLLRCEDSDEHILSARHALSHSRILELDSIDVDQDTFERFIEFAHTGGYRPEHSSSFFNTSGHGNENGRCIISPTAGHGNPENAHILADIRFVKFATQMRIEECRSYAIKRLASYAVVDEDPVRILEEVFRGREACAELREWVGKFLIASPSSSSVSTSSAMSPVSMAEARHGDAMAQTNLAKLEDANGPWRARFLEAVEKSGGLENEVRKASEVVDKIGVGWEQMNHALMAAVVSNQCRLMEGSAMGQHLLTLGGLSFPLDVQGYRAPLHGLQQQQQLLLRGAIGMGTSSLTTPSALSGLHTPALNNLLASSPYNAVTTNNGSLASSAAELEHLKTIERKKIRELERGKDKLRKMEREKDRVRETQAQVQVAAALEALYGKSMGGFVEEDSDGY
jgi:hypothetical protein